MQAQREAPPDMQCKDKFLVQSVIASSSKEVSQEMVHLPTSDFEYFLVPLGFKVDTGIRYCSLLEMSVELFIFIRLSL